MFSPMCLCLDDDRVLQQRALLLNGSMPRSDVGVVKDDED